MDSQQQSTFQAATKRSTNDPAPLSGSRTSSMQAETGSKQHMPIEIPKPSAKAFSDLSYSMNRWLDQKPSEEPWHRFRR
jgi:hypothetical protein